MSTPTLVRDDAKLLLQALRAFARTQQIGERADVRCCDMTVAQAGMVQILHLEGTMRLGALGQRLGITPSTLTRNVERAEARGLVARIPDRQDGRACCLRLTPRGTRLARDFEKQNETFSERVLSQLSTRRRRRAVEGFLDLLEAIDKIAGPCCPDQFKPVREFLEAQAAAKEV